MISVDDDDLYALIDLVWQAATDSQEVPSRKWADEIIARWQSMPQPTGDPR